MPLWHQHNRAGVLWYNQTKCQFRYVLFKYTLMITWSSMTVVVTSSGPILIYIWIRHLFIYIFATAQVSRSNECWARMTPGGARIEYLLNQTVPLSCCGNKSTSSSIQRWRQLVATRRRCQTATRVQQCEVTVSRIPVNCISSSNITATR